jgi:hypothetical protein
MARLSIFDHAHRFKPSIPGYGNVLKKTVRVTSVGLGSTQVAGRGAKEAVFKEGMGTAIPVSEMGLASDTQNTTSLAGGSQGVTNLQPVGGKCMQRLFEESPVRTDPNSPKSPPAKVPIRRRIVLPRLQNIRMQYREPRSPIVISESDSSDEPSQDEEVPGLVEISQVVGEILGRYTLQGSEVGLFDDTIEVSNPLEGSDSDRRERPKKVNSPIGF